MEKEYAFDQTIVDSNYERHMGGRAHRFVGRRLRLKEPTLEGWSKDYGENLCRRSWTKPATDTARRTRRYTSTLYIRRTIHGVGDNPMNDGGRYSIWSPILSNLPPMRPTLTPPFTGERNGRIISARKTVTDERDLYEEKRRWAY